MTVRVRVAPSPTGRLQLGNVRAALTNYLYALANGGVFILRIDDTDVERSKPEFEQGIYEDLSWLGLTWQETFRQSDRMTRYADVFTQLQQAGLLYPCYETPEELELKRKVQLNRGKPPVYDRAALALTASDRAALEAKGIEPHWRFKLSAGHVTWQDHIRGTVSIDMASLSDPILFRAGQAPVYTIASVADDADSRISHIIRGEDHVTNTAVQVQIFQALGAVVPQFAHFSLVVGAEGEKLSKRTGSLSLQDLRAAGVEPLAICSIMARLGTSLPIVPATSLADLARDFALSIFSTGSPKFDPDELWLMNPKIIHHYDFATVQPRLAQLGLTTADEKFWLAVRGNLEKLSDAVMWWDVVHTPPTVKVAASDADFIALALTHLPAEPWGDDTWPQWVEALKKASGRKGKDLFMPLRLALTGMASGPEIKPLLLLLGRANTAARLQAAGA